MRVRIDEAGHDAAAARVDRRRVAVSVDGALDVGLGADEDDRAAERGDRAGGDAAGVGLMRARGAGPARRR